MREVSKLRAINRRRAFAGVAISALFVAGLVGALHAGAAGAAGPTDTEPPPQTTTPSPAPDPAPPAPKPTPKRTPKPVSKPASHPATVNHAPVTPAPSPTYTPSHVTPRAIPKVVHRKKHRGHRRARHVAPAPKPQAQVKQANVVHIAGVPAAASVSSNQSDAVTRTLVITGIGAAALLFLLVLTVPATGIRFTGPGRILMDHQTDLVLVGIALLLLTALLFAVTGTG